MKSYLEVRIGGWKLRQPSLHRECYRTLIIIIIIIDYEEIARISGFGLLAEMDFHRLAGPRNQSDLNMMSYACNCM